jgi:pimeloyl-ACP methyl ester carboxylesterase
MTKINFVRKAGNGKVCLLFVHGFSSNSKRTWTGKSAECWTKRLGEKKDCDVVHFDYPNAPVKGAGTLYFFDAAKILADYIAGHLAPYEKIILVSHSFGGIIVKQMIIDMMDGQSQSNRKNLTRIAGITMISCPNKGHTFAAIGVLVALPARNFIALRRHSGVLASLHDNFLMHMNSSSQKFDFWTVGEEKALFVIFRVHPNDSKLSIYGAEHRVLPKNHSTICKELNEDDPLFALLCSQIDRVISKNHPKFLGPPLGPRILKA